ncbi:unnamed protein product [Cylindrotheca closterium]|uniref:UDENN domain-containing protein n=1 Tax=Cylindrotheca closterium TaxID=2856 RepID=A0AAD2FL07_9STRA|nr:unnamed protein product [Cylindrotheca closterium]
MTATKRSEEPSLLRRAIDPAPSTDHELAAAKADAETMSTGSAGNFTAGLSVDSDVSSIDDSVVDLGTPFDRLVDFFVVMGADMNVENKKTKKPTDLQFETHLIDCVPKQRQDMDFPMEMPQFCFPGGCRLSCKQKETKVFNFVLTTSAGDLLFLSAAMMYEPITSVGLSELYWDRSISLPAWLSNAEDGATYYIPKAIAVVSHYPYYDAQSQFLHELMRLKSTGSPLPLERYIANFVYDIPLPRPGGAAVRWDCFGRSKSGLELVMGSPNKLPMVFFSYEPLFRTLSVSNVLTLWATLLQEGKVVLQSNHLSLLTPVAEALLSLLFPFTWQGMYIPILPNSMVDAIEAPIPFLVGIHGECQNQQPQGVVICDLDEDIVHLGYDYNGKEASMPVLPRQASLKLKSELSGIVDQMYLIPACGLKGRITRGTDELLSNSQREIYGHMSILKESSNVDMREQILSDAGSVKMTGEGEENHGESNNMPQESDAQSPITPKRVVGLSYEGMKKQRERVAKSFYDRNSRLENSVRHVFLSFLTSLLGEYKKYQMQPFRKQAYLTTFIGNSKELAESLIMSQMFEQFLTGPEARRNLFDKCISTGGKETSKEPEGGKIGKMREPRLEALIPQPPYDAGVWKNKIYTYDAFPKLDEAELLAHSVYDPSMCSFQMCCWDLCGPK